MSAGPRDRRQFTQSSRTVTRASGPRSTRSGMTASSPFWHVGSTWPTDWAPAGTAVTSNIDPAAMSVAIRRLAILPPFGIPYLLRHLPGWRARSL